MGVTDESNKYLNDAEALFRQGKKKEALEKMLDSARASGIDLNHVAGEYGLSKSKVPVGGSGSSRSRSHGLAWGLGILFAIIGAIAGGVIGFIVGGIIGAVVGNVFTDKKKS